MDNFNYSYRSSSFISSIEGQKTFSKEDLTTYKSEIEQQLQGVKTKRDNVQKSVQETSIKINASQIHLLSKSSLLNDKTSANYWLKEWKVLKKRHREESSALQLLDKDLKKTELQAQKTLKAIAKESAHLNQLVKNQEEIEKQLIFSKESKPIFSTLKKKLYERRFISLSKQIAEAKNNLSAVMDQGKSELKITKIYSDHLDQIEEKGTDLTSRLNQLDKTSKEHFNLLKKIDDQKKKKRAFCKKRATTIKK